MPQVAYTNSNPNLVWVHKIQVYILMQATSKGQNGWDGGIELSKHYGCWGTSWFGIRVKWPPESMAQAKFFVTGAAWRWRQCSISSDLQQPKRQMTLVLMLAQSRELAPAVQRYQALKLERRNPRDAGDK